MSINSCKGCEYSQKCELVKMTKEERKRREEIEEEEIEEEIIRDIQKKENEIIKNMKNKAVLNVDMEINGKTWRKKTEYTKNSAGELEIKEFPVIILTGGIK